MYVGAVLSVIYGIVNFVEAADHSARERRIWSEDRLEQATTSTRIGAVIGTSIVVGLWLWMANKNGQGARWARVVGTIFGTIAILGGVLAVISLALGDFDVDVAFNLFWCLLAVWILVLLYRHDANLYFMAH